MFDVCVCLKTLIYVDVSLIFLILHSCRNLRYPWKIIFQKLFQTFSNPDFQLTWLQCNFIACFPFNKPFPMLLQVMYKCQFQNCYVKFLFLTLIDPLSSHQKKKKIQPDHRQEAVEGRQQIWDKRVHLTFNDYAISHQGCVHLTKCLSLHRSITLTFTIINNTVLNILVHMLFPNFR